MTRSIVVVGSLNVDLVARVKTAPQSGETVLGDDLQIFPGGKGANQAVAAARQGAAVRFVGCIGADGRGEPVLQSLQDVGVDISLVRIVKRPTGTAIILVDGAGENRIVVIPGANHEVSAEAGLAACESLNPVLVMQLEIPPPVVRQTVETAAGRGATVILNAAPAQPLERGLLAQVDHLIVNEGEAAALTGVSSSEASPEALVTRLAELGSRRVVLTLGSRGAVALIEDDWVQVAAPAVAVVDTTAAGDAFVGTYAAAIAAERPVTAALTQAVAAGSLAVTRAGAQPSLPAAHDVAELAASLRVRERRG